MQPKGPTTSTADELELLADMTTKPRPPPRNAADIVSQMQQIENPDHDAKGNGNSLLKVCFLTRLCSFCVVSMEHVIDDDVWCMTAFV